MNYLLLGTALTLSTIAAFYAIAGLVAIFAAAVIPIIVMGSALEVSKLVLASWIYRNWGEVPKLMKTYFTFALVVLMCLTSMGIFGYLSKAHLDQALPTGDVAAKIELIDYQIETERGNIEANRSLIAQMDAVVNNKMEQEGRTLVKKGTEKKSLFGKGEREEFLEKEDVAERALQIRRSQAKDRAKLIKDIELSQDKILKLQEQKAPISSELRNLEAEVGPIKYVAALIYGDNPDKNLLEKAVRFVIIMIVIVFDPLAVLMVIAANWSLYRRKPTVVEQVEESPVKKSEREKPQKVSPPKPVKTVKSDITLFDEVIAEDYFEPEQRGWTGWKVTEKKKRIRPVYEEFTIHSNIEETK